MLEALEAYVPGRMTGERTGRERRKFEHGSFQRSQHIMLLNVRCPSERLRLQEFDGGVRRRSLQILPALTRL